MGTLVAAVLLLLACVAVAGWVAPEPEHHITCHACGHESTGPTYRAAYDAFFLHDYQTHYGEII